MGFSSLSSPLRTFQLPSLPSPCPSYISWRVKMDLSPFHDSFPTSSIHHNIHHNTHKKEDEYPILSLFLFTRHVVEKRVDEDSFWKSPPRFLYIVFYLLSSLPMYQAWCQDMESFLPSSMSFSSFKIKENCPPSIQVWCHFYNKLYNKLYHKLNHKLTHDCEKTFITDVEMTTPFHGNSWISWLLFTFSLDSSSSSSTPTCLSYQCFETCCSLYNKIFHGPFSKEICHEIWIPPWTLIYIYFCMIFYQPFSCARTEEMKWFLSYYHIEGAWDAYRTLQTWKIQIPLSIQTAIFSNAWFYFPTLSSFTCTQWTDLSTWGVNLCLSLPLHSKDLFYTKLNPCLAQCPTDGQYLLNVRYSNYELSTYRSKEMDGIVRTQNLLFWTGNANDHWTTSTFESSFTWLKPLYRHDENATVQGLEDLRCFWFRGRWRFTANCCDWKGHITQPCVVFGTLEESPQENTMEWRTSEIFRLSLFHETKCEKNWMPLIYQNECFLVYKLSPFILYHVDWDTRQAKCLTELSFPQSFPLFHQDFRGSGTWSISIPENEEGWITYTCLSHEVFFTTTSPRQRRYLHRRWEWCFHGPSLLDYVFNHSSLSTKCFQERMLTKMEIKCSDPFIWKSSSFPIQYSLGGFFDILEKTWVYTGSIQDTSPFVMQYSEKEDTIHTIFACRYTIFPPPSPMTCSQSSTLHQDNDNIFFIPMNPEEPSVFLPQKTDWILSLDEDDEDDESKITSFFHALYTSAPSLHSSTTTTKQWKLVSLTSFQEIQKIQEEQRDVTILSNENEGYHIVFFMNSTNEMSAGHLPFWKRHVSLCQVSWSEWKEWFLSTNMDLGNSWVYLSPQKGNHVVSLIVQHESSLFCKDHLSVTSLWSENAFHSSFSDLPHVLCIHRPKDVYRRESLDIILDQFQWYSKWEFIDAVDADIEYCSGRHQHRLQEKSWGFPWSTWARDSYEKQNPKVFALVLSHIKAIMHFVETYPKEISSILIVEDDLTMDLFPLWPCRSLTHLLDKILGLSESCPPFPVEGDTRPIGLCVLSKLLPKNERLPPKTFKVGFGLEPIRPYTTTLAYWIHRETAEEILRAFFTYPRPSLSVSDRDIYFLGYSTSSSRQRVMTTLPLFSFSTIKPPTSLLHPQQENYQEQCQRVALQDWYDFHQG